MITIVNQQDLIKNGKSSNSLRAREIALQCLEYAINAVEPKQLMKTKIKVENDCLSIENYNFDLRKFKHIYVLGGGKAGAKMAQAIEEIMGKYITAGTINIPYGTSQRTSIIEFTETSHPIPDEAGVTGTSRIIALAQKAKEDDLIICLLSGGGSSLMPLPRKGISLKDKQELTDALLRSGANISEINVIRKHLSAFKGGWLAKKTFPASLLNIVLSDVMGDSLDSISSGPTVPDSSTFADAIKILKKYNLFDKTPPSILKILIEGVEGKIQETPKPQSPVFKKVHNFIIGNNKTATQNAANFLESAGFKTSVLNNFMVGEAKDVGKSLAVLANDKLSPFNISKSVAMIVGGETTVTVRGNGMGGRNQELALAAALNLNECLGCTLASLNTDGIDGVTEAAGAIIDGHTLKRARQLGLNTNEYLENNDSYNFFLRLKDLILTGSTGTNVNDLAVIIITNEKSIQAYFS